MAPLASAGEARGGCSDLSKGAVLQCVEAGTLGMPFEVWKTRMGRYRNENTVQAFKHIYQRGGVGAYWQGLSAKLVESATKGAVFLYSKEMLFERMRSLNFSETTSGFVAGAGGGICQTAVVGPCTYIVTALVTGTRGQSDAVMDKIRQVWKTRGIRGLYSGSSAIAFRQATNWASRQGFTELARAKMKGGDDTKKLTKTQEICAGIVGGTLSTWNQPFEVARIHMQATANQGKPTQSLPATFAYIVRENGPAALFKGIVPRICLGIWQTLFMVTGAKILRESFGCDVDFFVNIFDGSASVDVDRCLRREFVVKYFNGIRSNKLGNGSSKAIRRDVTLQEAAADSFHGVSVPKPKEALYTGMGSPRVPPFVILQGEYIRTAIRIPQAINSLPNAVMRSVCTCFLCQIEEGKTEFRWLYEDVPSEWTHIFDHHHGLAALK